MSSDTLRSRIAHLLRKSQKAVYLYSHSTSSRSTSSQSALDSNQPKSVTPYSSDSPFQGGRRGANGGRGGPRRFREPLLPEIDQVTPEKKYSNIQVLVWKRVNEDLSNSLRLLLRVQSQRELSHKALLLRDELYETWRRLEGELHRKRSELESAVSSEQFVKATILSEKLITVKSRVQAARAALNEFEVAAGDIVSSSSPEMSASTQNQATAHRATHSEPQATENDSKEEDESKVLLFPDTRRSARS